MLTIPDLMGDVAYGGEVTWHDLFCGGGGSSLGLHHVPGFKVIAALNHWDLAVQAHAANFPDTDHEVTEIEKVHPSRFARARCGWFSPSCTHHAYCRGSKDLDEEGQRSRATMWDVCRWADHHKYDVVVVENVIEVKLWCDEHELDTRTGKPGCSCGASYDGWIERMNKLGYIAQEVYFNSQHALVPQSRDRIYIVFSKVGIPLPNVAFTPPCYCSTCGVVAGVQTWKVPTRHSRRDNARLHRWGRYGKQYVYTCPTCAGVVAPAVVGSWSIIDHDLPIATIGSRKRPIAEATRKRIKVGLERIGQQVPIQLQVGGNLFERPGYARVWSLEDPLRTITTTPYMAVVLRAGGQATAPRSSDEPMMTMTAHDRQIGVVIPNKTNNIGRSTDEPVGAITTAPAGHMLVALREGMAGQQMQMPMPTQATRADQAIVSMRNHGQATDVGEPIPTVNAGGHHHGLLVYNGNPGFVRAVEDAAGTITSRDKQSLLVPYNRTATPVGTQGPAPVITASDRNALLEVTDEDIDGMLFRMLKWPELQRGQAMHVLPDGSPYQLTARVPARGGKYKELSDEQRVRMIGNAVSSPVAAMLGHSIAASLAVAA